jgi:tellurite resistance protein
MLQPAKLEEIGARVLKLRDRLIQRGRPSVFPGAAPQSDSDALERRVFPFAQVMLLVMTADSEITERERSVVRGAVRSLTDGRVGTAVIDRMLGQLEAAVHDHGRAACLEQVASHLSANADDSELAFALGVAVAFADDEVHPAERATLSELSELLGIPAQRARELLGSVS